MNAFLQKDWILIYQFGKVGSTSLSESLSNHGFKNLYQVHRILPKNIYEVKQEYIKHGIKPLKETIGKKAREKLMDKNLKIKIITPIRFPIQRNVSAFFENFKRFFGAEYKKGAHININELEKIFLDNYKHEVPLEWFDKEFKKTTRIDVYKHNFPKTKGWDRYKKNNIEALILKSELPDNQKELIVGDFLCTKKFSIIKTNLTSNKPYKGIYKNLLRKISFAECYIDKLIDSKFVRHFYSNKEVVKYINALR